MAPLILDRIVLGDINGRLQPALSKLALLHSKNQFSFAIVTGNLFSVDGEGVSDLLNGKIAVPLPTYFTVGTHALPQQIIDKIEKDEEICENLLYLGKRSTTKTLEGIKIVTLGGILDDTIIGGTSKEQYLPFHTVGDAKTLKGANSADILLTTSWPAGVRKGSKVSLAEGISSPTGHDYISELCTSLQPRYHFSMSPDFFYEREPFFHVSDAPGSKPLTRFISLAAWGTPKQKSLYAFTFQTMVDKTCPIPVGTTASPFTAQPMNKKRPLEQGTYSRYGNYDENGHNKRSRGGGREKWRRPPGPDECFFCLSNPNLATHLVSSIGDDAYLTIAKGPLTTASTNSQYGINYPAHVLIISLTHAPTLSLIPEEDRGKTFTEMMKFKDALQDMIAKRSGNQLGAITYEISRGSGVHTHWQLIPISTELISKGLVEAAFRVEAENLSYPSFETRDPGLGKDEGDFFRVWIYTPPSGVAPEGATKCLTMCFDNTFRFSLQFGRTVLAKLLNLEKRIQWRDCTQTVEEEKNDIEAFKAAFVEFDFTL